MGGGGIVYRDVGQMVGQKFPTFIYLCRFYFFVAVRHLFDSGVDRVDPESVIEGSPKPGET